MKRTRIATTEIATCRWSARPGRLAYQPTAPNGQRSPASRVWRLGLLIATSQTSIGSWRDVTHCKGSRHCSTGPRGQHARGQSINPTSGHYAEALARQWDSDRRIIRKRAQLRNVVSAERTRLTNALDKTHPSLMGDLELITRPTPPHDGRADTVGRLADGPHRTS